MMNTSRDTVVGVFQDERSAQLVVDELLRNGFTRNQVHLSSGADYAGEAASGGTGMSGHIASGHHGGGFTGWLNSLFGGDDEVNDDVSRYGEAVQRGNCVVAVNSDESTRERAINIMNDHGVVDVDHHPAEQGYCILIDGASSTLARNLR